MHCGERADFEGPLFPEMGSDGSPEQWGKQFKGAIMGRENCQKSGGRAWHTGQGASDVALYPCRNRTKGSSLSITNLSWVLWEAMTFPCRSSPIYYSSWI